MVILEPLSRRRLQQMVMVRPPMAFDRGDWPGGRSRLVQDRLKMGDAIVRTRFDAPLLFGLSVALAAVITQAGAVARAGEPVRLFDGKTLTGWEGDRSVFRVDKKAKAIVGGGLKEKVARNEFLCTTREYGDFELRIQCKLVGKGANAGVQFRSRRIPNHHEVIGYQADMGDRWWGKLYDESRRRKVLAGPDAEQLAKVLKPGDWNQYVIRCEGPRIQLWVNGLKTVDYLEEEAKIARRGVIALQIHGGPPSESWYREIVLVDLDKDR